MRAATALRPRVFCQGSGGHCEGSHPHRRGLREAQAGDRLSCRPTSAARSRSASASRASSATSPRTPSTTTRRTSRRCSSTGSRSSRSGSCRARVITKKEIAKDTVSVGSTVRLRDMDANKTFEYHIVGSAEANPAENKLSNESPVGKAIIGHKKGEVSRSQPRAARSSSRSSRSRPPRPRLRSAAGSRGGAARPAARRGERRARARVPATIRPGCWVLPDARRRAALLPWLFRVGFERRAPPTVCVDRRASVARRGALAPARDGRRCATAPRCARSSRRRSRLARGDGALPRLRARRGDAARRGVAAGPALVPRAGIAVEPGAAARGRSARALLAAGARRRAGAGRLPVRCC